MQWPHLLYVAASVFLGIVLEARRYSTFLKWARAAELLAHGQKEDSTNDAIRTEKNGQIATPSLSLDCIVDYARQSAD